MPFLGTIKLGDTLTVYCNTHTPSTGAAVDADAVPAYRCYEDITAAPLLTGNFALLDDLNTVGFYAAQLAVTTGNGFEVGKCYVVHITGVVAGVTGVELHTFQVDSSRVSDIATTIGTAGAGLTALGDTRLANLDAAVSSRSTVTTAQVNTEADTAISDAALATAANLALVKADTAAILADTGTDGVVLANDAITSAKFDESTAWPLKAADAGSTYIARTGADSDTLETLSDQIDGTATVADVTCTLAVTAAEAEAAASGTATITLWHTWSEAFTSTSTADLDAATKVWVVGKANQKTDADSEALFYIEESGGLTVLAQAAYATTTNGSVTVTGSSGDWTITAKLEETVTGSLENWADEYVTGKTVGVKALVGGDTVALGEYTLYIDYATPRAVS